MWCTASLVPRPPPFLLSVCVHNNSRERKTSEKQERPGSIHHVSVLQKKEYCCDQRFVVLFAWMNSWNDGHALKHFFPVNRSSWNLRSHGSIFLYQPFTHTNSYFHSCVPSSVSLWNQEPENFHHACTVSPFLPLNSLSIISIMLFDITFFL